MAVPARAGASSKIWRFPFRKSIDTPRSARPRQSPASLSDLEHSLAFAAIFPPPLPIDHTDAQTARTTYSSAKRFDKFISIT
ncbi:hypothetical protein PUN4_170007 [Paraburkholderia unamae]|nr:hypothetical protein PUN4_170007 [Paraburkholderia unamae]